MLIFQNNAPNVEKTPIYPYNTRDRHLLPHAWRGVVPGYWDIPGRPIESYPVCMGVGLLRGYASILGCCYISCIAHVGWDVEVPLLSKVIRGVQSWGCFRKLY